MPVAGVVPAAPPGGRLERLPVLDPARSRRARTPRTPGPRRSRWPARSTPAGAAASTGRRPGRAAPCRARASAGSSSSPRARARARAAASHPRSAAASCTCGGRARPRRTPGATYPAGAADGTRRRGTAMGLTLAHGVRWQAYRYGSPVLRRARFAATIARRRAARCAACAEAERRRLVRRVLASRAEPTARAELALLGTGSLGQIRRGGAWDLSLVDDALADVLLDRHPPWLASWAAWMLRSRAARAEVAGRAQRSCARARSNGRRTALLRRAAGDVMRCRATAPPTLLRRDRGALERRRLGPRSRYGGATTTA